MAQVMELDEFAAFMAGADALERGSLLKGIVVRREDNGSVLIDIGAKSEGIIPRNELGEEDINVGDEVEVVVVRPEDDEGHPILSKRRADFERLKREIAEAKESGAVLQATVKESVKGGLLVDLGVSAFIPASHVDIRNRSDLARLVGRVIPVRIIEVDFKKNRDKVIASHRLASEEEREKRETEAWSSLEKDKIVEGIVRRITDFGAFVDIGGLDGLLHVREMAWGRVEHPSQVVKKGPETSGSGSGTRRRAQARRAWFEAASARSVEESGQEFPHRPDRQGQSRAFGTGLRVCRN
jgi:4-hydroxy-3-methylbut-2-enyl diphosphate reductase